MNTTVVSGSNTILKTKTQIFAAELLNTFEQYADKISVLSLDCFDTLIWRKIADPKDLFYDLEKNGLFKTLKYSARMRIEGEHHACQTHRVRDGIIQAKLTDIYQAISPSSTCDQINTLVEQELQAETEACYAFPPIVELIRRAHALNKKIIIVSDIYLDKIQLRQLLSSKLPADVMSMIAEIFVSCEAGKAKAEGLFNIVLNQLQVSSSQILHIGDNQIADFIAPKNLGIYSLHLIHHSEHIAEILRMQAVAASFVDPSIRNSRSLASPFRGLFASEMAQVAPANLIGYTTLGPILYAFACYLDKEINQLRQAGKNPKILFLMRDGYLPYMASAELAGESIGACVRISRFTAFAAAFRNKYDVEHYLAMNLKSLRFRDMCTQLLLPEDIIVSILKKVEKSTNPASEFASLIQHQSVLQVIFKKSTAYRQRLQRYLEKTIDLKAGDTLVFVDLGYTCTTQIKLEPVLREEMGVEVYGRYLIATRGRGWNDSRRGLIDPSFYDDKALGMLIYYIAVFEKLCSASEKSVVDFDDQGNPVYAEVDVSDQQLNKLVAVQTDCLRFIRDVRKYLLNTKIVLSDQTLRDMAAINLSRLIYFPTQEEIEYLNFFQCEINIGAKEVLPIFDLEKGLTSLRHRTWLHCTKENVKNMRLTYPYELRSANIELSLALMSQHRFGFDLALNDMSLRREKIQIVYMTQDNNISTISLEAMITHDGYYSLLVPIAKISQLGIRFGEKYKWVELESAQLIKLAYLFSRSEYENAVDASANLAVEQMVDNEGGLFNCLSEASMLIYVPPVDLGDEKHILRMMYRPIVKR